jgi:DDE superfamily endonuclease
LFKECNLIIKENVKILADTGYQGIQKIHSNSTTPIKRKRNEVLTTEQKDFNHNLSSKRIVVENVIGFLKKFHIVSDRYRNRRKRFGLRFNLIASFHNYEL